MDHCHGPLPWTIAVDHCRGPLPWTIAVGHCYGLYDIHIDILVLDLTKEDIVDEDFAVEALV